MKTIKFFFAAFCAIFAFCSCSFDNNGEGLEPTEQSDVDYLVMFYAVGGGNLDDGILENVMQLLYEGSNEKVTFTVQYKLSADEQMKYDREFGGVRRLTGSENQHLKSKTGKLPTLPENYGSTLAKINSERFAEKQYDMTTSEALADFITWSKQKYPGAKHTILILNDHGSGWDLDRDGAKDVATRAILFDDNTSDGFLSAGDVAAGVKAAGKVDMIYTDACLMSMYENLYAYADACKYMLTAVEVTPGRGGNYMELLRLLKTASSSEAGMEAAMQKYADYCTSKEWWGQFTFNYNDLGLYNLEKLKAGCTPVLRKIAETLAEKYVSDESIMPTAEELHLGDTFAPYIRVAVNNCMVTYTYSYVSSKEVSAFVPYLKKDGIIPDSDGDFRFRELIEWTVYAKTSGAKEAYEAMPYEFLKLQRLLITSGKRAFSLTDMLRVLCNQLDDAGAQNNPFKPLRAELLAALKTAGHVACTQPDLKAGIDQAYDLCSPAIFIAPLNDLLLNGYDSSFQKSIPSVEDGIRYYQGTRFDQQVGWSRFLQVLDVVPNAINPMRKYVK